MQGCATHEGMTYELCYLIQWHANNQLLNELEPARLNKPNMKSNVWLELLRHAFYSALVYSAGMD